MFPVPFPRQGWHPVAEVEIAPPLKATSASALGRCGPAERRAKRTHSYSSYAFLYFLTFIRLEDQELFSPERL